MPAQRHPTLSTATQRRLVHHLMTGHPMPWHLEIDWTVEVTDSKGEIVIKCMHVDEANEIIELATALAVEDSKFREEFERLIAE